MPNINTPNVPISGNNTSLLVSSINRKFAQRNLRAEKSVLGQMGFIDMVSGGAKRSRDGSPARESLLTMASLDGYYPMDSILYSDRPVGDTAPREWDDPGIVELGPCRAVRRDGAKVKRPIRPGYDQYGLIQRGIGEMTLWGTGLWDRLIIRDILLSNPVCTYDKVQFFANNHRTNPLDDTSNLTFSNLITGADLDEDGYSAGMNLLSTMVRLDGITLANGAMGKPWLIVGSYPLFVKGLHLFNFPGALIAKFAANTAAASQTTVLAGDVNLVYLPYLWTLSLDPLLAGSGPALQQFVAKTYWMVSDAGYPPWIIREEMPPYMMITGDQDWPRIDRDAYLAFIEAYTAVMAAEPRSIIQITGR